MKWLSRKPDAAGTLRDEGQLPAFLAGLARNLAIEHSEGAPLGPGGEIGLDRMESPAPSAVERLEREEDVRRVARVLGKLSTDRDRAVLRSFYLGQEDKDVLCAELGVDRLQFNRILESPRDLSPVRHCHPCFARTRSTRLPGARNSDYSSAPRGGSHDGQTAPGTCPTCES